MLTHGVAFWYLERHDSERMCSSLLRRIRGPIHETRDTITQLLSIFCIWVRKVTVIIHVRYTTCPFHWPLISFPSSLVTPHLRANVVACFQLLWLPSIDISSPSPTLLLPLLLTPEHNYKCSLYHGLGLESAIWNMYYVISDKKIWQIHCSWNHFQIQFKPQSKWAKSWHSWWGHSPAHIG